MPSGYWGKILHVDLTEGKTWVEEPDEAFYRKNMGGRAFIAHYLLSEVPAGIDAFDPANRLIFAAGPITGTPVPGAGRHSVGAKSPLNNGFGESESGGFWGAELKKAGWDAIVILGKASRPTYLWINDQTVELRDGSHLWGRLTDEVEERIREDHGDKWIRVAQCGIAGDDLVQICKANQWLNLTGMDAISFGATLAWATECYELGLLTNEDTGGVELKWGDGQLLNEMVMKVARREKPLGDLLAEGSLRAARKIGRGTEQYSVHIKGVEIAMHDPRAMDRMRTNYPVTPTGGDHTGAAHHRTSNRNTVGVCQFLQYSEEQIVALLNGATGWDTTVAEIEEQSSRGLTMARLFNLREGIGRKDDVFPQRIHEPIRKGPLSNHVLTREQVAQETEEYYRFHGWDRQEGIPLAETLDHHGLWDYAGFIRDRVRRGAGELPFAKAGAGVGERVEE